MSEINLYVEPQTDPMEWDQFIVNRGPFAVALDGYVAGAPRYDESGPRINFNHHEGVDRLATAATCEQVLTAIRSGFFQTFKENGMSRADIYVNDCDQDVCTSYYLLTHGPVVEYANSPLVDELVAVESKLDATAGSYPYSPDLEIMRKIAWIFEPYTSFRNSGEYDLKEAEDNRQIIEDCAGRIHDYVMGRGKDMPLDVRFEVLDKHPGYTTVHETGEHARLGMFASGIDSFLSVQETKREGFWRYTIGRRSHFIPFPVEEIFAALNQVDPAVSGLNRWGGGNVIGGCPRATGSNLTLAQVSEIIDNVLEAKKL